MTDDAIQPGPNEFSAEEEMQMRQAQAHAMPQPRERSFRSITIMIGFAPRINAMRRIRK